MIVSAMGNRLLFTDDLFVKPDKVIKLCEKNKCDGLFTFDDKQKVMRYFDCDGVQNYCGNAARSLPLVLGVNGIRFTVAVKDTLIPMFSWKDEEGFYATSLKIQEFKELRRGESYWAFVGNFQKVKISSFGEFQLAKKIAKRWAKMEGSRPPIYSFVLVECETRAKVRVIEEFGKETASCCSSASVVTKVMSILNPQRKDFVLQYAGGTFFTHLHNSRMPSLVTLRGECEIC
jgi:diaminopimelate epimerase